MSVTSLTHYGVSTKMSANSRPLFNLIMYRVRDPVECVSDSVDAPVVC